jgi:hypothetical protein
MAFEFKHTGGLAEYSVRFCGHFLGTVQAVDPGWYVAETPAQELILTDRETPSGHVVTRPLETDMISAARALLQEHDRSGRS